MDIRQFELLQINDATFPIGSYTFSWGLETFVQQGIIHDRKSAFTYIKEELCSSFLYTDLLALRLAFNHEDDEAYLLNLDERYGASRVPFEIRSGSEKLSNRFIKTTQPFLKEDFLYKGKYYPITYGIYCARKSMDLRDCLSSFLYSQTSARITTAVKLVPLSQSDGQIILHSLFELFDSLIERCLELDEEDFCLSCPGIDIRSMQHEYLYTRLYSN